MIRFHEKIGMEVHSLDFNHDTLWHQPWHMALGHIRPSKVNDIEKIGPNWAIKIYLDRFDHGWLRLN